MRLSAAGRGPLADAPPAASRRHRGRAAGSGGWARRVARRAAPRPPPAAGAGRARRPGRSGSAAGTTAPASRVEVTVYPDLPAARRLRIAVRTGRFRQEGRRSRGPLGLGTEFESVRDYLPDDDIRQVNWRATERLGRPMSNTVPRRARPRRPLRDRLRPADVGAAARPHAARRCRRRRGRRGGGRRGGRRPLRRARLRPPSSAGSLRPAAADADAVVRALFDLEPEPFDSRLRARVPACRRGEAGVRDPLHRPARAGGRAAAARRIAAARRGGTRSRSRARPTPTCRSSSTAEPERPRRGLPRSGGGRGARRARARRRAAAPRRRRLSSRRRRTRSRPPASRHICGEGSGSPVSSAAPERPAPRRSRRARSRRAPPSSRPVPGGRDEALDEAGDDEPRRRAEHDRDCGPRLPPQGRPRASAVPARRSAQPNRSPAAPATTMHESSSTPCAVTSSKNGRPLPAPIARPETTPRSTPLHDQHRRRADAGQDAAGEREDGHADVVREDLARRTPPPARD